jgi:hypothetical protein
MHPTSVLRRSYFAALSLLPTLAACSGSHSLSHQELQTEFRASISLAAETAVFLSHLDGHAYSRQFIDGHLSYLRKEGSQIENELAGASVETPDATSLDALRKTTGELTQTLDDLHSQIPTAPQRTSSIDHLHAIRKHLEADMPR